MELHKTEVVWEIFTEQADSQDEETELMET